MTPMRSSTRPRTRNLVAFGLTWVAVGACTSDPNGTTGPVDMGSCDTEVIVSADITEDTTWSCNFYALSGRIHITRNATLTIAPGTTIFGDTAGSQEATLIVTRGASLNAVGTAINPIVFTSGNPAGTRITGDWAGLALLGSATINSGSCSGDGDTGTPGVCDAPGFLEGRLEGLDVADSRGLFGGGDDTSSCGDLQYVRIEYAGAELSPDNELNGLTVAGCGSGTTLSHIQVHRAKDDGVEFFGGTANIDHLVVSGASDDSLDCDLGWRGQGQFLVLHQIPGVGDSAIECDNLGSDEDAEPRTHPTLSNVTMVGTPDTRGMVLREGMRGTLRNFLIMNFGSEPVDLRASQVDLFNEWPTMISIEHSFFFNNGAYPAEIGDDNDDMGFDEQAVIEDPVASNTIGTDPILGDTSPSTPNLVPANTALNGQATPTFADPSFGDTTATYAGAFEPGATTNWTSGWTAYPEY